MTLAYTHTNTHETYTHAHKSIHTYIHVRVRELIDMIFLNSKLVCSLSPINRKDYIRAKGDFHKDIYSSKAY